MNADEAKTVREAVAMLRDGLTISSADQRIDDAAGVLERLAWSRSPEPSPAIIDGRHSREYVRWQIDKYKSDLNSDEVIAATLKDALAQVAVRTDPSRVPLPEYCFARECILLAIIELLQTRAIE